LSLAYPLVGEIKFFCRPSLNDWASLILMNLATTNLGVNYTPTSLPHGNSEK